MAIAAATTHEVRVSLPRSLSDKEISAVGAAALGHALRVNSTLRVLGCVRNVGCGQNAAS